MNQLFRDKAISLMQNKTPQGIIGILADKLAILSHAKQRIDKEGLVVRDLKGSVIPHPALNIIKDAEKTMIDLLKIYGV